MNTTKTSIGEVAYIDANVLYKNREEAVLEGFRLGKISEFEIIHREGKTRGFPDNVAIWCEEGMIVLDRLDVGSRFYANYLVLGYLNWLLRGVFVVKEENDDKNKYHGFYDLPRGRGVRHQALHQSGCSET